MVVGIARVEATRCNSARRSVWRSRRMFVADDVRWRWGTEGSNISNWGGGNDACLFLYLEKRWIHDDGCKVANVLSVIHRSAMN